MDLGGRSSPVTRYWVPGVSWASLNLWASVFEMLLQNYRAEGYEKALGSFTPKTIALIVRDYLHMFIIIKKKFKRTFCDHQGPSCIQVEQQNSSALKGWCGRIRELLRLYDTLNSFQSVSLLCSSSIMGMRCENSFLFLWDSSRPHKQFPLKVLELVLTDLFRMSEYSEYVWSRSATDKPCI